jgi:squalene-hopene/tetraprenyl-beta-curcumene cyclase
VPSPEPGPAPAVAADAVQRATRLLLARQDADGWWTARPAGDGCLDAEALLLREFLGIRTAAQTSAAAQQLRSLQRTDGSWAGRAGPDGCGELSASVLAYLALRFAGDSPDAYRMAVAAGWIRDAGGIDAVDVFARIWLAAFGLTEWAKIRVPAPEVVYLPERRYTGHSGQTDCSRQAMVTLAVIGAMRPLRQVSFDLSTLMVPAGRAAQPPGPQQRGSWLPPVSSARAVALRSCGHWLADWQQRDGHDRQGQVWPHALLALFLLGYPLRHPVLAGGLAWLDSVTVRRTGAGLGNQAVVQPPVRDTVQAIRVLADAGLAGDHPALVAAGSWLLARRIHGRGNGSRREPSGWSFGPDGYPAVADTAEVLVALSRVRLPSVASRPAVSAALGWLTSVQAGDGNWARDPAVTGMVVHALAACGQPAGPALRRGVVWLLRAQHSDGCWAAGPADSTLRATATVLPALLAAGVRPGKPVITEAIDWLLWQRRPDGGWAGQDWGQRSDPGGTALALSAVLSAGLPLTQAARLGADWLVRAQQADGGWGDRPAGRTRQHGSVVGGVLLPLGALGRYVAASREAARPAEPARPTEPVVAR